MVGWTVVVPAVVLEPLRDEAKRLMVLRGVSATGAATAASVVVVVAVIVLRAPPVRRLLEVGLMAAVREDPREENLPLLPLLLLLWNISQVISFELCLCLFTHFLNSYLSTAKVTDSVVLGGVAVARMAMNGSTVVVA